MNRWTTGLLTLVSALVLSTSAFAQGGGASSTGTIQGRVVDAQGAVLPGVTVTAASPALLGQQTAVTSETGNYRFPAVPSGTYTLTYELPGFNTVKREGIQITLGFTANVNVELALATLQETVTVTGESPIIDTTSTRTQQNFKLEQLNSIPNGRDMWALLAVTPGVQMSRIDVGGNRAGTQTGYTAYGFTGQVRVLIEGINTTEGTDGAGFYFDYASLEEAFLGTQGQSAEMPNPGVQSQFIAKSGGNTFNGEYYLDWYNNALQGSNTEDLAAEWPGFRTGSNEIQGYYDTAIQAGGPIKRDKIWYFGTYRTQQNKVEQPLFRFDQTFDTKLWNPVVKGTYQINQQNKLIGYYQWGQKIQANRLPQATYFYDSPDQTFRQDSGSWVYKAEWNGTLSDKLYVEARYGDFGYYFPQISNSDLGYYFRDTGTLTHEGSVQRQQNDRDRKQITAASTYFLDTTRGSHTFKIGGEILMESQWTGYAEGVGGNIDHQYTNGVANQLVFWFPTAREVGTLKNNDNGDFDVENKLDVGGAFINDTWALGRLTMNAGVRWDRYRNWLPDQRQVAFSHGIAKLAIPDAVFPETEVNTWNSFAPRLGMVFDLTGDGRTVVKANYGLYWHNPGVGLSSTANQNQSAKNVTYRWTDLNGDRRWQSGEEGATPTSTNLAGSRTIDPDLKQPYTHEFGVFLERQLAETLGSRVGFVYKTEDDLFEAYQIFRGPENYTVAFPFTDIGPDGRANTGDERILTLYGIPSALASTLSVAEQVTNTGELGRYKTFEASVNKRYSNKWSATVGGSYSFRDGYPTEAFPQTPNHPGRFDRTNWDFKVTGSYDAPWGIRVSPVLRHQSGDNFARTISVPASAGNAFGAVIPSTTIYADAPEDNRRDNITLFDVRAEKTVQMGSRFRTRLFLDVFNIGNANDAETITVLTGTNYLRPTAVLAPRTMRVGFRLLW